MLAVNRISFREHRAAPQLQALTFRLTPKRVEIHWLGWLYYR